ALREHEVVDNERILARREELREAHLDGFAVWSGGRKDVVLGARLPRAVARAWRRPPPPSRAGARSRARAGDRGPSGIRLIRPESGSAWRLLRSGLSRPAWFTERAWQTG